MEALRKKTATTNVTSTTPVNKGRHHHSRKNVAATTITDTSAQLTLEPKDIGSEDVNVGEDGVEANGQVAIGKAVREAVGTEVGQGAHGVEQMVLRPPEGCWGCGTKQVGVQMMM